MADNPNNQIYKVGFLYDDSNVWIQNKLSGYTWLSSISDRFEYVEIFDQVKAKHFDILFILGNTKLLPKNILATNNINLVVHESDLPEGRGFSPVQWQILEGKNIIPVCLIEAVENTDSGDIYYKTNIYLGGHELLEEIRELQAEATKDLIVRFLSEYPHVESMQQVGEPTYYRRLNKDDDYIDPDKTIKQIFNRLRVANNDCYPVKFKINDIEYKLKISKE